MKREQLVKFIKESRGLVAEATTEQKIKLLKLIKEATVRLNETAETQVVSEAATEIKADSSKNADYLDEV